MWSRDVVLDNAGFAPCPIDRVFGQQTLTAVEGYQQAKGPAKGGLAIKTLESLSIALQQRIVVVPASIETIGGIGPKYAEILKGAGITNTAQLLSEGSQPRGRRQLAVRLNIAEKLILKWVTASDLFRIRGVAGQYAELLEAAGVDTVKDLCDCKAASLAETIRELNEQKRLVRQVPNAKRVEQWIEQAKLLEPAVFY